MVTPTVPFDGDDDPLATRSASPSAVGNTRTGEPLPAAPRPQGTTTQPRDPERYQVIGEHGRGGLGRVSRAHDRDLGRDIAIKELISRGHVSEVRFLREALITARLEHPGIVPVYEAGRWPDGTPFYAMKLVAGRPLRDLIAERQTVDERIGLLHHVIAVADAIAYAHGRNIIHRDLKPSNVIVGDFGETVVIDWGLAKDLSTTEESTLGGSPFRANHDTDLTATGSVLGTPAYMAPEQERGEQVDQRADVFAIGAMLWELCALQKVPPADPDLRHRILRRSGIDRDLITITDKALDPDPARRYPDAGALAADLKAFKAGARIAARSYSLFGMLAHWTRRHRTLAVSLTTATALTIIGVIVYVRDITNEQLRTDEALAKVVATQEDLSTQHSALTLKHAELLITIDPTAALDALATYKGTDRDRAALLHAEATGRGAAFLRTTPHTASIPWIRGISGNAIISLSRDGTISRTTHDGQTKTIANGVAPNGAYAYAPSRHLLAYICNPADLCLVDVRHSTPISIPRELKGSELVAVTFSPNEHRLATVSQSGEVRVLDITTPERPSELLHATIKDGGGLLFADDDTIAVGTIAGLELWKMSGSKQVLLDRDGSYWDAFPSDHLLLLATTRGEGYIVHTDRMHVVRQAALCNGPISGIKAITKKHMAAYICKEGTIGTWNLSNGEISRRAHLGGHANMLEISEDGDYIVVAGDHGILTVLDLSVNLVASLKGHGFRLTAISPPSLEYAFMLSADVRGGVRAWPLPIRFAKSIGKTRQRISAAFFSKATDMVIAMTRGTEITTVSMTADVRPITPNGDDTAFIATSSQGRIFATYGQSTSVTVWSSLSMSRIHTIDILHGSVSHVAFIKNSEELVISNRNGELWRWTSNGEWNLLYKFKRSLQEAHPVGNSGSIVLATDNGEIWGVDDGGHATLLRPGVAKVTRMQLLPDGVSICVGYSNGEAILINTTSRTQIRLFQSSSAIRDIAVSDDGNTIAMAANDGTIHVRFKYGHKWADTQTTTLPLAVNANKIVITLDGLLIAICSDGSIKIHSTRTRDRISLSIGTTDLTHVVLTKNEASAIVFDADGHITSVELDLIRKVIQGPAFKPIAN